MTPEQVQSLIEKTNGELEVLTPHSEYQVSQRKSTIIFKHQIIIFSYF